jgi:hypothetical protein
MSFSYCHKLFVKLLLFLSVYAIVYVELVASNENKKNPVYNVQIYKESTKRCLKVYAFESQDDESELFYFNQTHLFMQEGSNKLSLRELGSNQTRSLVVKMNFYFSHIEILHSKSFSIIGV